MEEHRCAKHEVANTRPFCFFTFTFIHWAQRQPQPRIALSAAVTRAYLGPLKRGAKLTAD